MSSRDVDDEGFADFFRTIQPRLSYALAAAYGIEVGHESTADALTYAWENWSSVRGMDNPGGFLFRVGQSKARRYRRTAPKFPTVAALGIPDIEPGLPKALESLSPAQRVAVVLIHVLGWSESEAAELIGVDRSTIRRHRDRGLSKLRAALGVRSHG
ncbi:MAG: sigma-70 family RNA polymerase sigma factor [Acidimicrobiia bacterium]